MKELIKVSFVGGIRRLTGVSEIELEVVQTVADAVDMVYKRFPQTRGLAKTLLFVLNGEMATGPERLKSGDEVVLLMAIAGG